MQYISTRGLESSFSFSDILFEGYAEDGGLYVPAVFPKVDAHTLMTWRGLSYASLAFEVIRLFAEELPKEDLWQICSEAYQAGNFGHTRGMFTAEEITPVKWLHDQVGLLELSNGPTLAFDDIAVQINDDHILRRHAVIRHTGGLDDDQAALAVDAGDIAPCAYCRRNA